MVERAMAVRGRMLIVLIIMAVAMIGCLVVALMVLGF
jgi:hypothetical protein